MKVIKLALIGNPNIGKSSLFNHLTGLRQKVGNYPGVTVDKKTGVFHHNNSTYKLYDLPGTYSLYPTSQDEEVAADILLDPSHPDHPDNIIVVADATNLKRSLQILEQVLELRIPALLVVNLQDEAVKKGIRIDIDKLRSYYGIEVEFTNARSGSGLSELKQKLQNFTISKKDLFTIPDEFVSVAEEVKNKFKTDNYKAWQLLSHQDVKYLTDADKRTLKEIKKNNSIISKRLQVNEFLSRNKNLDELLKNTIQYSSTNIKSVTTKIDRWTMHPFWGYVIFGIILFAVFQSIFTLSEWPMKWIETGFLNLSVFVRSVLPPGPVRGLIADGIIPGIGGILIFVPQITILFFLLLILEETGYMSRVVFLMDRLMRPFGLNGKSVVPLMSGAACAIPAVMSARNIEHKKERLITILVTPFMTCSARLPVYTLIIGLVFANTTILFFNVKGLILLGMYLLGLLGALLSGLILKMILKDRYKSYLAMELPIYRSPVWKNVFISLWEKIRAFVFGAGKIILAISIILWVLASFGPGEKFSAAKNTVENADKTVVSKEEVAVAKSYMLEYSYLGRMGNAFEPVIRPLGYDWKTGIGILASFAAREVFVPTMATIYSISDVDDDALLKEKMQKEINIKTGKPVYNTASGISLLLFYAFAMMCMSTFAAVKRETKSWKWPFIQLISMSILAYVTALIAYQILK